jgi:hypothetical protein
VKGSLALICVAAAAVISISSQNWQNASEHFTIMSITASQTPTPVVTVTNHEGRTMTYVDDVYVGGKLRSSHPFTLVPGQLARQHLAPLVHSTQSGAEIKVVLTRGGSQKPYREVWFRSA